VGLTGVGNGAAIVLLPFLVHRSRLRPCFLVSSSPSQGAMVKQDHLKISHLP
jgi:hypothetical protein